MKLSRDMQEAWQSQIHNWNAICKKAQFCGTVDHIYKLVYVIFVNFYVNYISHRNCTFKPVKAY